MIMKFEQNSPAAFVNAGAMEEDVFLGTAEARGSSEATQAKTEQTLLTGAGGDGENEVSAVQGDRWKKLSRQVRGALAVKNAVVKPNKRKISRKSTANVDPFLQRFSPREIGLTTQVSRASLRCIAEDETVCSDEDDAAVCQEHTCAPRSTFFWLTSRICKSPTGIIDPDGSFLYYWLYFLIVAIRYNLWVIILRFAFTEAQENQAVLWWLLDSTADLIYVLDIAINCRVGFYEEGILVKDSRRVYRRYLKSLRFFLDLLSVFPLELLYFHTGVRPILRFPRLLKIYRSQGIKSKLEGRSNHPTFVRVFFLIHLMFLLLHWNAGIYFLISRAEGFGSNGWLYPALNGSYNTLTRKYVYSFYWSALTLTTIGDLPSPETNVEYFYTIACYLSGVFMFAMIVGNAGSIILDRNASRLQFEKQRDNAKHYMKIHNVPGGLQRRVLKWYDYSWSRGRMSGGGGDLNSLHLLPDKMKTEIALHVHLETLKKVTFLQNCEPEFLHELLLKMRLYIFTPGDLIIRHGEIAREMYLIANGRIEVISETGKVLKELGSGDFFGEIGILSLSEGQNRRTADVRSIGYTECFVLSKDDVLGEIQQFPQAQKILAEYGRKRLQNTSGDPRLVKLDSQDTETDKTTSEQDEKSHVVHIDEENLEKHIDCHEKTSKMSQDGRVRSFSREHSGRAVSALLNTTKELVIPALVNRDCNYRNYGREYSYDTTRASFDSRDFDTCSEGNSNKCDASRDWRICDARDRTSDGRDRKCDSRDPSMGYKRDTHSYNTEDLNSCLNTLDSLKVVLQNFIENKMRKHEDYVSRLECDLTVEKERIRQAELKINAQTDEMFALRKANRELEQTLSEKETKLSKMEFAFQAPSDKHDIEDGKLCDSKLLETDTKNKDNILLEEEMQDYCDVPRSSPTETDTTVRDTAC